MEREKSRLNKMIFDPKVKEVMTLISFVLAGIGLGMMFSNVFSGLCVLCTGINLYLANAIKPLE